MHAKVVSEVPSAEPATDRAEPHGLRERIGDTIGRLWAPAVAAISHARHGRMFHPEGLTFAGYIEPHRADPADPADPAGHASPAAASLAAASPAAQAIAGLASQLAGRVLVRCSGALWRGGREHLDVLGFALRIRRGDGGALDEIAQVGDQDLLFATIRSPFTMLLSPLFTDATDFVDNRYWAVSPFAIRGARFELRVSPVDPAPHAQLPEPRASRLLAAVHARRAIWQLEARETWTRRWHPVARIALERPVTLDQDALQFDPFRAGLGMQPVGLVHAIRRAAYAASRAGRAR